MSCYVYILYAKAFDRYYIGQTKNIELRIKRHNNGYEKATSPFKPWDYILVILKETRGEAMILEKKLKNLSRERLLLFIEKYKQENIIK